MTNTSDFILAAKNSQETKKMNAIETVKTAAVTTTKTPAFKVAVALIAGAALMTTIAVLRK